MIKTDWEEKYQNNETPWDKGYAAPPLAEYLEKNKLRKTVLVPGCGYGYDVRLLAKSGASALGLDIAPSPIRKAREFPQVADEEYRLGNFLNLDQDLHNRFDWIFEHTCFCAIKPDDRENYVRAAHQALKPGAYLLAIFFVNIEDPEGPPFPISEEEINSLFDDHFTPKKSWVPQKAYPGRENRELMRILQAK